MEKLKGSVEENIKLATEMFHDQIARIMSDAQEMLEEKDKKISELETRVQITDSSNGELRSRAGVAERQLSDVLERQQDRDTKIARLLSRLQVIKDQFAELEVGDDMADRAARGEPLLTPAEQAPYRDILQEIGETLSAEIEQKAPKIPRALERLFGQRHDEPRAAAQ